MERRWVPATGLDVRTRFWTIVAAWKYRHADPDICCCGCEWGKGGDICHHGGCRSAKEFAMTAFVKNRTRG